MMGDVTEPNEPSCEQHSAEALYVALYSSACNAAAL